MPFCLQTGHSSLVVLIPTTPSLVISNLQDGHLTTLNKALHMFIENPSSISYRSALFKIATYVHNL